VKRAGLRHVWFTVLGLEGTHDALCGRSGAFAAIMSALQRCSVVGLETGVNIVVSTRNTRQIGELGQRVRALGAEQFVPTYVACWSPSSTEYEAIRPESQDLAGLPPAHLDVNWAYASFRAEPEAFTEGLLTRAALNSVAWLGAEPQAERHAGGSGMRAFGKEPAGRLTLGLGVGETTSLPTLSAAVVTWRLAGGRVGVPIALTGLAGRLTRDGEDGSPGAAAAGRTPVLASRIPPANILRPRLFRRD
jgi:hypothetical protein